MIVELIKRAILAFLLTILIAYMAGQIYLTVFMLFLLILFIIVIWEVYNEEGGY